MLVVIAVFALVCAVVAAVLLLDAGHTVTLPHVARSTLLFVFVCLFFVALLGIVAFSYLSLTTGPVGP